LLKNELLGSTVLRTNLFLSTEQNIPCVLFARKPVYYYFLLTSKAQIRVLKALYNQYMLFVKNIDLFKPRLSYNTLLPSLRSGQWRLGSVSLMVISYEGQPSGLEDGVQRYTGFQYDFQIDDVLLGEGTDLSMLELRPTLVTGLEGNDLTSIFNKGLNDHTLLSNPNISKEDSMREYADLKFSLLFYDAMLTLFGTSVASFSAGENAGIDFLIGGIGGFLYLLLLQKSVDELPASELITSDKGRTNALFKGVKGPIASVALALGLAVIASRYSSGDLQVMLTPKDLIVGMMGFLVCKVSVLLAAFKPIAFGPKSPTDL